MLFDYCDDASERGDDGHMGIVARQSQFFYLPSSTNSIVAVNTSNRFDFVPFGAENLNLAFRTAQRRKIACQRQQKTRQISTSLILTSPHASALALGHSC